MIQFSSVAQSCPTLCYPMNCMQHTRPPCLSPSPGACSKYPLSRWCYPTISSSVVPFSSSPQSFPASGSFPMSQPSASGGQSIGVSVSASVFSMNIQGWFPLGLTGWLDLLTVQGTLKSLLQHTVWKHQFFSTQPSLWSTTSIHDYWKKHSFDYIDLCRQSNVCTF